MKMPTWRVACLLAAVVAFLLAALPASPPAAWLPGPPDARTPLLFWVGVVAAAGALWRRGGG